MRNNATVRGKRASCVFSVTLAYRFWKNDTKSVTVKFRDSVGRGVDIERHFRTGIRRVHSGHIGNCTQAAVKLPVSLALPPLSQNCWLPETFRWLRS